MQSQTEHNKRTLAKQQKRVAKFYNRNKEVTAKRQATEFSLHLFLGIVFYLAVAVCIVKAGKEAYSFAYPIFGDISVDKAPGKDIKITIVEGEGVDSVIQDLWKKKVIVNKNSFKIRCKLSISKNNSFKARTHTINTSMNYEEIIRELVTE